MLSKEVKSRIQKNKIRRAKSSAKRISLTENLIGRRLVGTGGGARDPFSQRVTPLMQHAAMKRLADAHAKANPPLQSNPEHKALIEQVQSRL